MAGAPSQASKAVAAVGTAALAGGFYWFAEPRLRAALEPPAPLVKLSYSPEEFAAESRFSGHRPGWVFKVDHLGLGYYKDRVE